MLAFKAVDVEVEAVDRGVDEEVWVKDVLLGSVLSGLGNVLL